MIDWSRIKTFQDEIGKEDFAEVVDIFIEEVSELIERLRTSTNSETLGADLHALKGSALNLGFTRFAELCQTGETLADDGRANEIALDPILRCYDESKDVFIAGLHNGQAD